METQNAGKVKGVVEQATQNSQTRYGVRVAGIWYNGFGKVRAKAGDMVEIAYTVVDGYTNIREIKIVELKDALQNDDEDQEKTEKVADAYLDKDARITKAVALKCACTLLQRYRKVTLDEVFFTASGFEKWLNTTSFYIYYSNPSPLFAI